MTKKKPLNLDKEIAHIRHMHHLAVTETEGATYHLPVKQVWPVVEALLAKNAQSPIDCREAFEAWLGGNSTYKDGETDCWDLWQYAWEAAGATKR